ncbi:MAG TPA: rhodanese-like domain-containing protein, partial [Thermoanaerobaculia bacterium]|nr:rhodanese-like domain-containing protein [Thermoanaerobaculia bacterium]
ELLFDGKSEAEDQVRVGAAQRKAEIAKERERLVVPADAVEAGKLASRYASPALGPIEVKKQGKSVVFDFGEWHSAVASRKNDDGTTSFITIDPTISGFDFVVADRDGKKALVTRDAQHEYVFRENGKARPASVPSGMLVSPDWLAEHRGERNLVLLHVGVAADFEKEHIPGAIPVNPQDLSIPRTEGALLLQLLPPDQLHAKLESYGIGDDSRVIVYFAKDWVSPTTRVYFSLDAAGLGERTSILDGGMPAWKAAGGTVVSSANDPASAVQRKPGKLTAKPHPELVVGLDFVKANLATKGVALVDSRNTKFFDGTEQGAMPRAGHIPGARNLPFDILVTDDDRMKDRAETARLLEAAGVQPGDTVVSYCHIGQQATVVYFAAKRLGYKALLYDGSWDEWSRKTDLPIEKTAAKP